MLVGVMLAEKKLGSGGQLGAHPSCSATAVCSSQLRTGQSCVHGSPFSGIFTFSDVRGSRRVPRPLSGVSFLTTFAPANRAGW
ncbi:hypothetical protein ACNJLH_09530 [Mycobacterium tuberculosis]|uniref:hypothetical protein n=2 Tax=Mycobacterium tuberculosis TaxID=1773 RepID=UPI000998F2BC|nr:hypothetical protein [Mycobacterium tuberculosis]PHO27069.1 hypothetical protein B6F28_14840 [Mycobacterium tuberculosis variant bovis]PHO52092.1 hypothetical protein B6F39_14925 [Mycobacterium tuberculosis variant bovis]PHO53101.1 hypothetical protein B6F24_14445 [Mycobacterium tuberculosis variant bovis]PHO78804.1 hypothetical protein B6F61_14930 [Mycobacterium tuberculosis variant bovis]PHP01039.1 hypothetical protein B6F37_14735 [Mycobacterium tuberculosis variant bovis]